MDEQKAYDFKKLMENLKSQGIEVAEEVVKAIIISSIDWLDESAKISLNKYDDMLVILYPVIKEKLLGLAEKINPNG